MTITNEDMHAEFTRAVTSAHGADRLRLCFQCGTCTAGCPVVRVSDTFRPQVLMRMAQFGLEELALNKKSPLWLCATCYNCTELCPQDAHPAEVFLVLKGLAARRGVLPMGRKMGFTTLVKRGRMFDLQDKQQQERAELGLAPCPEVDTEKTQALLERGGVLSVLTGGKK